MYEFLAFFRAILNWSWLPTPVMGFVERVCRKIFHLLFKDRHIRFRRYTIKTEDFSFFLWLDWQDYTNTNYILVRYYEKANIKCLLKLVGPSDVFIDCGANVGYFSLVAAQKGAKVIAVEPMPISLLQLQKNSTENKVDIVIEGVALAEQRGQTTLKHVILNSGSPTTKGIFGAEGVIEQYTKEDIVPTKSLIDIFHDNNISERRLIKLDIQGSELSVLKASKQLLADKKIEYILCEYNSGTNNNDTKEFLSEMGYYPNKILQDGSIVPVGGNPLVNKLDYVFTFRTTDKVDTK